MKNMISKLAAIFTDVQIGKNCRIEDFCVIGKPAKGDKLYGKKTIIGDNSIIRTGTVIYAGTKTKTNFQTGDGAKIGPDNIFGDNVIIGSNCVVLRGCALANGVVVHSLVELAEWMQIGENSWIGPGVKTANMIHPKRFNCPNKEKCGKDGAPIIGKEVRIGINASINPFVKIGDYAIVASGAHVTKDVPAKTVVAGNPAKPIKKTDEIVCQFDKKIFPYKK